MPGPPPSLTLSRERAVRHGFVDRPAVTVAQAAAHTVALQAQDERAGRLGVRSRSTGLTDADVVRAVADERGVVRTALLRATVHLVATADVRWLTALCGPAIRRRFAARWRGLGLTVDLLDRTAALLPDVLDDRPRTRREILAGWRECGVDLPEAEPLTGSPTHALLFATSHGLVCRGPDRGREPTFVLASAWVPDAPEGPRGDAACAELARRFFRAYSPATAADLTAWSGLPSARAIALVRDELTPVDVAGRPGFRLGEAPAQPGLRLLAGFDDYLVGYRDRTALIDPAHRPAVYAGGVIRPTVLVDGRVAGTWRLAPRRSGAGTGTLAVRLLRPATRRERADLEREAADVSRFLATPLGLEVG